MTIENCGSHFNLDQFLDARLKTIQAVQQTASKIQTGMNETEAHSILANQLSLAGAVKFWHPSKFRIGANTVKSFKDISDEVTLSNDDIFFIDIGPVFLNHEGDYGETFVLGNNPKLLNLKMAAKNIFLASQKKWKEEQLTGEELYRFASSEALKYNLELNTKMYGHRLGDFPHALYYKGKLGEIVTTPSPHLWVLEIHVIDHSINRGAFYEDILI